MVNNRVVEASYIRDLIFQRDQIIFALSKNGKDRLWTDCAESLPDELSNDFDPTYLEILVGMDSLLELEDCPEESIMDVKDFITKLVDDRTNDTIDALNKRIEVMDQNISYLKKKFVEDHSMDYDEAFSARYISEKETKSNLNIDEILDKISERGIGSLTNDEERFLNDKSKGKNDDKKDE